MIQLTILREALLMGVFLGIATGFLIGCVLTWLVMR